MIPKPRQLPAIYFILRLSMKKAFLIILFIIQPSFSQEFFISPNGNDKNPGTKEKPFATLEKAREAVRIYKKTNGYPKDGITVWVGGGDYQLTRSFELNKEDSGKTKAPIKYSTVPGDKVRMIGGVSINPNNLKKVECKNILERFDPNVRDKILQLDLKRLGITNYGEHRQFGHGLPVVVAPLELYIDHKIMTLAKYPNTGAIMIGEIIDPGSVPRIGDYSDRGGTFKYTDARHEKWSKNDDIWFQGTFKYGFADDKIKVEYIDTTKKTVKMTKPHIYGIGTGENFNQYVAMNILEELDMPGEWFLDKHTGILYLFPLPNLDQSLIEISILEQPLLCLMNTSNVIISGLTFEVTRGMGIYMEGGENNLIAGCTIRNTGTTGIMIGQGARQTFPHVTADDYEGVPVSKEIGSFQGHYYHNTVWDRNCGKNNGIQSCDIYNNGSGGILLGGGSKKDLVPGGNFVINCRIHDFQLRNKAQWAGINVDGCGNLIAHNEIYNADLQAIFVRGNEHIFEYNTIHHVAMNSNDASAWYLGRDPSDRGNIVRYNFIHHVGRTDRKWIMGVYFDDASCDGLVEGNVFYKVATFGTVYSNGGQDIVVRNNIFIDNNYGPALQLKSMWWDFALGEWDYFFGPKGVYRVRLTKFLDIKRPPYSTKYPNLVNWIDLKEDAKTYYGMYPARNLMENNVLYNYEESFRLVGINAQFEFKNNFLTKKNPGFIDEKNMNFQLLDNSIVYVEIPGFKKIPFEKIGLYRDNYRKQILGEL
jgi:parallel beta-helix repeat protein